MSKINPDFPHDVFRFLIKPLRDLDTDGVLERYLGGVQSVFEATQADIARLPELANPDTCPADLLQHLKWIVGWTPDFDTVTASLTEAQLRKIIKLSVAMWKLKGSALGIVAALRTFTGRDVIYRDWFWYRWVTDQTGMWAEGVAGTDPYLVGGPYDDTRGMDESVLWVSNESSLSKQVVHDIVMMMRPINERIVIRYAELVDDFQLGMAKWDLLAGIVLWREGTRDLKVGESTSATSSMIRCSVDGTDGWNDGVLMMSVTTDAPDDAQFEVHFMSTGAVGALLGYSIYFDVPGQQCTLRRHNGDGTHTSLSVVSFPSRAPSGPTLLTISTWMANVADRRFVVGWDSNTLLDFTQPDAHEVVGGAVGVQTVAAVNTSVILDNVIFFKLPQHIDVTEYGSKDVSSLPAPYAPSRKVRWREDGSTVGGWTLTSIWHLTDYRYISKPGSIVYTSGESGYYTWGTPGTPTGADGSATSPNIDYSGWDGSSHLYIEWDSLYVHSTSPTDDVATLDIIVDGVTVATIPKTTVASGDSGGWVKKSVDVTSHLTGGSTLRIKFNMASASAGGDGWYIDNVALIEASP